MPPVISRHLSATPLLALCLFAAQAYAAPAPAGEQIAVATASARHDHALPASFRKGNVYLQVVINGHPPVWMNLDTGTTDSLIDANYAAKIGLALTPKASGVEGFGSTKVDTFSTGKVNLQAGNEPGKETFFESIHLDGMTGPDGVPLAGLLGHSFLAKHVIVIDYLRQEVYFDDKPQAPDRRDVPMVLSEGIPRVALTMAGKSVNALIDTGGTYDLIITPATAKELGIEQFMADATPAGTVGHGGHQAIVVGKAPPFSIGTLAVHDVRAAYTTFGTATDTIGAGVSLGNFFLKAYKLTLNYAANTVRFEP